MKQEVVWKVQIFEPTTAIVVLIHSDGHNIRTTCATKPFLTPETQACISMVVQVSGSYVVVQTTCSCSDQKKRPASCNSHTIGGVNRFMFCAL